MNCPHCNTENDNDNVFCVSCGKTIAPEKNLAAITLPSPTEYYHVNQVNRRDDSPESVQTLYKSTPPFDQPNAKFDPIIPFQPTRTGERKSSGFLWLGLGALLLLLVVGGGIVGYFLLNKQTVTTTTENLPDHLGIFIQNKEKNNLTEIGKQDYNNAVQAKDDLLKNESLPVAEDKPNLLLFYDSKEVPLGDLKLVQIDSIKDDGSLKQISYQAAPVDNKPEIKRLRVPDGLANGRYAFALFDGFLDEGKHKFWAFQVKNAPKSDNGDLAKAMTLSLKPKTNALPQNSNSVVIDKPAPTPKPAPSAPSGAQVAYCKSNNVVMRNSPNLTARKVSALKRGQKIYIINYSENYDYWNGMEGNWAYIQTESGSRGWVFSPLIGN
jgi:hypothetical protein